MNWLYKDIRLRGRGGGFLKFSVFLMGKFFLVWEAVVSLE